MKKLLFFALAGIALASCSDEEFVGDPIARSAGEITFSQAVPNMTRTETTGAEAAEKLGYNFMVYGYKNATGVAEDINNTTTNDQVVFDYYNVNYTANTANTTLSNSDNWEYVGYTSGKNKTQTIKYWDFSTSRYVFSAIAGNVSVDKITTTNTDQAKYKGWTVTVPAGYGLNDLYASNRRVMSKSLNNGENSFETVKLTFYSLITKVRFGIYETVPGYSVTIDKFYYTDGSETYTTDFALDGTFKTQNPNGNTLFTVTYESDADKAKPVCDPVLNTYEQKGYGKFGSNINGKTLGTTSNTATYDQDNKAYNIILPYESLGVGVTNVLKLKVDYTLTSTDDSGEQIHVKGATATVPEQYIQWKNSYAYTYLFKISDNTNGTTGDPSDPDPDGLYPITFDAVVVADADDNQETITSVATPSITTYQAGQIVTNNDEYVAGTIYYSAMTGASNDDISSSHVYELYNMPSNQAITEKYVAEYKNNQLMLIEIGKTMQTSVAGSTFAANTCYSFEAEGTKTYAINCGTGWKIVKVVDTDNYNANNVKIKFNYTGANNTITTADGAAVFTLNKMGKVNGVEAITGNVIDANSLIKIYDSSDVDVTDLFTITESANGTYTFDPKDELIAAGANGTYTVKFNTDKATATFTIDLTYALNPTAVIISPGQTSSNILFTINATAASGTVVNNYVNDGITVTETATGTYTVTAASTTSVANYAVTIGGVTLNITVGIYAFSPASIDLNKPCSGPDASNIAYGDATGQVSLTLDGNATSGLTLTSSDNSLTAVESSTTPGTYDLTATTTGSYTLTYENGTCNVEVKEYSFDSNSLSLDDSSKPQVSLSDGNANANITLSNITITDDSGTTDYTSNFTLSVVDDAGTQKLEIDAHDGNSTYVGDGKSFVLKYTIGGTVVAMIFMDTPI